tara:strand:- start:166 stop:552 length:387 start_codon:yes stop_codon:yes gene_type:complete
MKFKTIGLIIILITIVSSCGTSFGKKKEFGNLEVFYSDNVPIEYVDKTGQYFIDNNLVLDHKHSIKLTSNHNSFILKMILDTKFEKFPKDMRQDVMLLESDIKSSVFNGAHFKIEICDVNFYPLNLKN